MIAWFFFDLGFFFARRDLENAISKGLYKASGTLMQYRIVESVLYWYRLKSTAPRTKKLLYNRF